MPRQRCAPALPIERRLFSSLPTCRWSRGGHMHFADFARTQTQLRIFTFARQQVPEAPARAQAAPLPGNISVQWIVVPTGTRAAAARCRS
jgi:hypothetical protein